MLVGCELHNILVCFFMLAEELAQSAEVFIEAIHDPSYRLL